MTSYVLVHGAWHTGAEMEPTAQCLRDRGHQAVCPTLAGNAPGDARDSGLTAAIDSLTTFIESNGLDDFVLLGHSYGGMVITGAADKLGVRIRRLIYWNAFVPNHGECLNDMVPPHYVALFDSLVAEDGSVTMPYPIWRDAFINDADGELAQSAYDVLNPHPYKTFTEAIELSTNPADLQIPKSYLNCTEDIALPQSLGWHPRLSEKLGLFRLVQCAGSHELCFTDPARLADAIIAAGRD